MIDKLFLSLIPDVAFVDVLHGNIHTIITIQYGEFNDHVVSYFVSITADIHSHWLEKKRFKTFSMKLLKSFFLHIEN